MNDRSLHLAKRVLCDSRTLVLAAVALISAVIFVLARGGGPDLSPPAVALSPQGGEVGRLDPVRVIFEKAPKERDGASILSLDPAVAGSYAWLGDRTLLFQPDYPGYLRGFTYTALVRAQPDAGLGQDFQASFETAGKLKVISTIPADGDEDVPAETQVLVQFSRSVAPLSLLAGRDDAPVLEFTPALEGEGEWLNTSLYRFVPAALAPDTSYTARIPAGLTSAADGVLADDYSWSFKSFGPSLVRVTPDRQTQYAGPRQPVVLEFNQPMDRDAVEAAFSLTHEGEPVAGTFTWTANGTVTTFTPSLDLAPLATHTVSLPAGLPGANGGRTLYGWESSFKTVGPLRLVQTEPPDGSTSARRWGFTLTFSQPIDLDSLDGRVSVSGVPTDELEFGWGDDLNAHFYTSGQLKPSTFYTVTLTDGIADRYGQTMGGTSFSFTTEPLPSMVSVAAPAITSVYSASTEPVLYFHASNVETASFTLSPLTRSEFARFATGDPPDLIWWSPSGPPLRRWSEPAAASQDEVQVLSTSLSGGGPLPIGDYFVRANPSRDYGGALAFSVVDTEIVLKLAYDELLAWAVDHDTGRPVAGAQLEVVAGSISALETLTAVTDRNGLASFPLKPISEAPVYSEREFVVSLDDGSRYGLASTEWQRGAPAWSLGLPIERYPSRYKGHIYTDRPVYRPGETVGIKTILRDDNDANYSVPDELEGVDVVIRDPQGRQILRQEVRLSPHGTFPVSLDLADKAATGDYYVALVRKTKDARGETVETDITGTTFLVAEFRRPEFEVTVAASESVYAEGDTIPVTAESRFFFGGALAGASVRWSVLSFPTSETNEDFRGYSFSNYDYWRVMQSGAEPLRGEGEGITGSDGTFGFEVPAALLAGEGPEKYTISATVVDQNGQAMAASTTVTVHPADRYAGIRSDKWIGTAGEPSDFSLVTLTKEGQRAPNLPVRIEVYDRHWVTTKYQTPEGARQYRSEPVDELLTTIEATTGDDAEGSFSFEPESAGTLRLVATVTDSVGREARAATYLWVAGPEHASWRISNDDLIDLIADKEEYEPGDTAEVLVPAPFENAIGLITVERGSIHNREVRSFTTTSERLSIPLGDRSIPNVFVSVVLYRPPIAEDPIPRYKVGYANLEVTTESRRLHVSITPNVEQAEPGQTVGYIVEVTDWQGRGVQSELSVSVVDKAVLALEEERSIDGLRAFWFERGLGVRTSSSLAVSVDRSNDAIPAPSGEGKGGGGGNLDRLRSDFRNSAYWEAQIQTDARGVARVAVPLPDNVTTWLFQARAISGDILVGEATNELRSTRPLLLRPALPRFLRVGDQLDLRVLVRNATAEETDVTVSIEAAGVQLREDGDRRLIVAAGASETIAWPAAAVAEGTARIVFSATAANGTDDAVAIEIPVHLDVTPEAVATNGVVGAEPHLEAIYLPEFAILEGGSLNVAVQPTLVGSITSELPPFWPSQWSRYFGPVEYASRAVAVAGVLRAVPPEARGATLAAEEQRLRNDIAALLGAQRADGGWPWCLNWRCRSDPLVTAWVLLALGEAGQAGIALDGQAVSRADSFIAGHLNRLVDVGRPIAPAERAMYLYALARAGRAAEHEPEMRAVYEQYRAQLPPSGQAYLLLALREAGATPDDPYVAGLLNSLITTVEPSANGNHWEDPDRAGLVRTPSQVTALVLTALARMQPDHPLLEETIRWLTVARDTKHWTHFPERAQAVLALSEFAAATGELGADFSYEVGLNGEVVLDGSFDRKDLAASDTVTIPLTDLGAGSVSLLEFARKVAKAGRLYYKLDLEYLTAAREIEALNRGFAVSQEYSLVDAPDHRVDGATVGDVVRVKVTVVTTEQRNYVLVRDHLPAGLEPIDTALDATDPALVAALEKDRKQLAHDGGFVPKYWAPWYRWYYSPWLQVDLRDNVVELRTDSLPAGVHEYVYYARATTPGTFFVAPARAEEGLFPEVFGRSDSGTFTVTAAVTESP